MSILPPLPAWESLHPAVVHFPIALLMTAPVFVVMGVVWGSRSREMFTAALLMLLLGTAGAWLATATGDAGEKWAKGVAGASEVLHEHEEHGELARNLFTGLSLAIAILTVALWVRSRPPGLGGRLLAAVVWLGLFAWPALTLAQTAHLGGRLVHDLGLRAPLSGGLPAGEPKEAGEAKEER